MISSHPIDSIEDAIYEAAFLPERWTDVLERIGATCGAEGAAVLTVDTTDSRWVATPPFQDLIERFVAEGWMGRNIRADRAMALDHPGFVRDHDILTDDEMDSDESYGFFRRHGWGWVLGTLIRPPTGDVVVFNWERRFASGPFGIDTVARLDPLRPHLARAGMIASRLQLERARAATALLDTLGLAAGIVSTTSRLVAANAQLEGLMPHVVSDRRDRVRLADPAADARLCDVLAGAPGAVPLSIPIRPLDRAGGPYILHLLPVRGLARDVFASAAFVLVVTPLPAAGALSASLVQGLFDLTPAEARVARRIAEGATVDEIAQASGTAVSTVRAQLRSVFAKTGFARQADIVRLLATPFRPG